MAPSDSAQELFSVAGKTALVTGATGGIGLMIARGLAEAGARVFITGRKQDTLSAALAQLADAGDVEGFNLDVSTAEGVDELATSLSARAASLDILINNAGTTWGAPLEKFPDKAWASVMGVNVQAPFMLVQRLLPMLERAGSGTHRASVINIGSIFGISPDVALAYSYGASKAAIHHLTRILARDLCARGINVNAIAPGLFPSKMTAFITRDAALEASMLETIPMGRAGTPEDIVGAVRFLCSRAGSYVTGVVLPVDGGRLLTG